VTSSDMNVERVLPTTTAPGLHKLLLQRVLPRYLHPGERVLDLGAGSGAFALQLHEAGCHVAAADIDPPAYQLRFPFIQIDFNQPDFASQIGAAGFGLITAIEVIEHVESPVGFLRNIRVLLKPGGVAVLTTPNVDSTPARIKFLLRGTIRMMDAQSEKTHITPIFWDLFTRQYLPLSELHLVEHHLYPARGYQMTRRGLAQMMQLVSLFLGGACLYGDNHIIVLGENKNGNVAAQEQVPLEAAVFTGT
jgi:SAM-dependent methyltransferase